MQDLNNQTLNISWPSEDTPIFSIIANTLGQFYPIHFWSLIIPQLMNFMIYKNSEV